MEVCGLNHGKSMDSISPAINCTNSYTISFFNRSYKTTIALMSMLPIIPDQEKKNVATKTYWHIVSKKF